MSSRTGDPRPISNCVACAVSVCVRRAPQGGRVRDGGGWGPVRHGVASRVVLLEGESRSDDGGDVERGHIVHLRHGLGCGCIIAATALQMTRCIIDSHGSLASAKDQPAHRSRGQWAYSSPSANHVRPGVPSCQVRSLISQQRALTSPQRGQGSASGSQRAAQNTQSLGQGGRV